MDSDFSSTKTFEPQIEAIEPAQQEAKPSRWKTFNYAVGMFGTSIPINLLKTYAFAFFVDGLGVTAKQWGLIMLIYAFIDAADNPIYGILSDRTRTRWGRRRPWLVIGTPLLVLCLVLFFSPPAWLSTNQLFIYAMLFYILTGTLDSVINANYGALFPELFKSDHSRGKANALRQAFQLVAMIISIALTPVVVDAIGWSLTAIIYGVLGGVVILYMSFTSHEEVIGEHEAKPKVWESLKTLLSNRKFWVAGISNAFYSAAMAMVMAGLPLYAKYALGISGWRQALLMGLVLVVAIASVAVWAAFLKRHDLVKVWRWALVALALSYIPLYFARGYVMALICASLVGFGFAGVITTMDLIHARVMDEDKAKHNVRREGIISNALGFMNRLNSLFTGAAFLLLKSLYGYESGEVPGSQPDQVALFIIALFPLLMMILSFATSFLSNFEIIHGDSQPPQAPYIDDPNMISFNP